MLNTTDPNPSVAVFSRLGGIVAAAPRIIPEEEPRVILAVSRGEQHKEAELTPGDAIRLGMALVAMGELLQSGPWGER